jgi:glutamate-1-semialdehyde 2,1-aminomutase
VPVRVANLSTIWTVLYTSPRATTGCCSSTCAPQGLALSWVGTGRLIFSLNYDDASFDDVVRRIVAAATAMQADGWWWHDGRSRQPQHPAQLLKEMLAHRFG